MCLGLDALASNTKHRLHVCKCGGHQGALTPNKFVCEILATQTKNRDYIINRIKDAIEEDRLNKKDAKLLCAKLLKQDTTSWTKGFAHIVFSVLIFSFCSVQLVLIQFDSLRFGLVRFASVLGAVRSASVVR